MILAANDFLERFVTFEIQKTKIVPFMILLKLKTKILSQIMNARIDFHYIQN